MNLVSRSIVRPIVVATIAATLGLAPAVATAVVPARPALAASQPHLPFRCFAPVGVDHVVFGPQSFFLPRPSRVLPASRRTPAPPS